MNPSPSQALGQSRRRLVLLALLFAAPVLAAYFLYFKFPEWIPESRSNHGTLVTPARPLPAMDFLDGQGGAVDLAVLRGKWTYLYQGGAECSSECRELLVQYRQVRLALNEKRVRVQRVYLAPNAASAQALAASLQAEHPDLAVLADPSGSARAFFDEAPGVLLLDPHANWVMSYAPGSESRGIFKDIKRLLRLSQIG